MEAYPRLRRRRVVRRRCGTTRLPAPPSANSSRVGRRLPVIDSRPFLIRARARDLRQYPKTIFNGLIRRERPLPNRPRLSVTVSLTGPLGQDSCSLG